MLCLGSSLMKKPILSLRTSAPVGDSLEVIINPNNLKIEGWHALDRYNKKPVILLSQDVRDILPQGFAVNDHESLSSADELIRLKPILEIGFSLLGKQVVTDHKKRLGKVVDYAFDKDSMLIQKLYIEKSLIRSLQGGGRVIGRNQVVEVTDRKIVVREATVPETAPMSAPAPAQ